MIKAGERVKIIGVSRKDAGYHRRKTLVGQCYLIMKYLVKALLKISGFIPAEL